MARTVLHFANKRSPSAFMFDVKVLRSASDRNRFWWLLRDQSGRVVETSSSTYSSEVQAFNAADAAATRHTRAGRL